MILQTFLSFFHAVVAMDSTVANDWRSWVRELETGLSKDHELGLELGSPEVQLHYMSGFF